MQTLNLRTKQSIHQAAGLGIAVAALTLVAAASGQDALGGGDALDANLSTAGTRNTATASDALAYRVRNLLVTGNVAGGRGFRGSVGYTAAEDFRGALGSDDTFGFRAESAFSAPSYLLFRNQLTDLQIGQDLSTLEFRRETTPLSTNDIITSRQPIDPELRNVQLRLDRLITDSSLAESIERAVESRPIGVGRDSEGNVVVPMTSGILGVDTVSMGEAQRTAGMTILDRARLYEDLTNQTTTSDALQRSEFTKTPFAEMLTVDSRISGNSIENRVDAQPLSHDDLLKKVAERYTGTEELDDESAHQLDQDYVDLRQYLHGFQEQVDAEQATDTSGEIDTGIEIMLPGDDAAQPADGDSGEIRPASPAGPQTPDVLPTLESFGIALRHDQTVKTYASGADDRFNELIESAEQSLATGEFFWAERRFNRALRFRPLHPLASAGKAHAQLGAGLYTPAALSLRQVLMQYPELIDVRYDRDIMPSRVRLQQNIDLIRERLEQGMDPALMGFLLAYIGHQSDDQAMIDEGFEAMEAAALDDRLLPLLQKIWSAETVTDE